MKTLLFSLLFYVLSVLLPGLVAASVAYDADSPQVAFAAGELEAALADGASFPEGHNLDVALDVNAASGLDSVRLYLNGIMVGDVSTEAAPM